MRRVGRYLAVLAAFSVLLAILGRSFAYLLSWLVLPIALLFGLPGQFAVHASLPAHFAVGASKYILVIEALVFFAIALAIDTRAPNGGRWLARFGLVLCCAQIVFLMSETGVGR